jgi:heme a synthase
MINESTKKLIVLRNTSLVLTFLIFINIFFGPLVRATDSGLACPDWPLCYGKVLPPPEFRIWMEHGHRIYSALLGFIFLFLMFIGFIESNMRKGYSLLLVSGAFVLINQVVLGKLTVTKLLNPGTVNLHLLNAVLFFLIVFTIYLKSYFQLKHNVLDSSILRYSLLKNWNLPRFLAFLIFVLVYFQLFMGGRVSSNYAGLACPDWPTCHGTFFPKPYEGPIQFQMEHRWVAYFIFVMILVFSIYVFQKDIISKSLKRIVSLLLIVCFVQIILGIWNVLYQLPVLLTASHTANGVLLLLISYSFLIYTSLEESVNS